LSLHQNDDGQIVLNAMGTDRFTLVANSDYDTVRELVAVVNKIEFRQMKRAERK
jgi:hypothetical protein